MLINLRISEIAVAKFPGGTQRWTRARARLDRRGYSPGGRGLEIKNRNGATRRTAPGRLEGFTAAGRRSREGVGFCESEDSYERGLAAFVGGTTTAYHFRSGAAALPLSL